MAPEIVSHWLKDLHSDALVLDPMCGSGVVLRQSLASGRRAVGYDMDPLAVLMSRVWTRATSLKTLVATAESVVSQAKRKRISYKSLPWVRVCHETRNFMEFWFAEPQRTELARLSWSLSEQRSSIAAHTFDGLLLALSRTIITKQSGASLAWDTSHSRPHKKIDVNEYDVYEGFIRAAGRIASTMAVQRPRRAAKVMCGDGRYMAATKSSSVDAIVTSPPYLNAIDYMRGHRLALVWMGYTLPALRAIRAAGIGTENTRSMQALDETGLASTVPNLQMLPERQQNIVRKYSEDSDALLNEFARVIKPDGRLVLVLADSVVRGVEVASSAIFASSAKCYGFKLVAKETREIPDSKRYLPIRSSGSGIERRMRCEIVQVFTRSS